MKKESRSLLGQIVNFCFMKKEATNKFKIFIINIVAMVAVLVGVCFITLEWIDSYTRHGEVVEVPDVRRLSLDDAVAKLRECGLDFEISEYKYYKGADENEVIDQTPVRRSQVKEGRKIQLVLNSAKEPMMPLPAIVDNCSLREAEARLRAAGFKLAEQVKIKGETDWVYHVFMGRDTLSNGDMVPVGATLTLYIGSGEEVVETSDPVMEESWFE